MKTTLAAAERVPEPGSRLSRSTEAQHPERCLAFGTASGAVNAGEGR